MKQMTLLEHLEELRLRLIWSLAFFGCGIVLAFSQRTFFMEVVGYPHRYAMKKLGLASSLYVFRYQDSFISQFKVCLMAGFIISFPFIIYHALKFISAGLFPEERKKLVFLYLPFFLLLFVSGSLFSYFLLIPYGLHFLAFFGKEVGLTPMISFSEYVSFFVILTFITGLVFELPLVMAVLVRIGLLSSLDWRHKRRVAILVIFIVSAMITPTPDPLTQTLLAVPLIFLYEIGCWLSVFIEKGNLKPILPHP
ncbi:MAG: twin arginine-targeting protein translocase TatC [Deltaproteobacteria bacterium GWA2_38_16]|nr:MAG: twin arginine-targeting protein translocase TatC [Deltaproteobacteria bacterium GWA2_38_16]OGQ03520.1 MAG: twin arginine-targeting protein translocase TatC [Deltaproteobacteria bacterium RIFCSPHIGHO2_02_FULL_38_15]OGQ30395.1 MAG: twin arginine-targeting protein translocase TatC [Deltaproteobacteria bacterium RIFCSPLOWO2_01_FULL_38_9]HBQ21243.1 twin-arginine translocase subunit TatC [Deltaproteobacteria bacterium]